MAFASTGVRDRSWCFFWWIHAAVVAETAAAATALRVQAFLLLPGVLEADTQAVRPAIPRHVRRGTGENGCHVDQSEAATWCFLGGGDEAPGTSDLSFPLTPTPTNGPDPLEPSTRGTDPVGGEGTKDTSPIGSRFGRIGKERWDAKGRWGGFDRERTGIERVGGDPGSDRFDGIPSTPTTHAKKRTHNQAFGGGEEGSFEDRKDGREGVQAQ